MEGDSKSIIYKINLDSCLNQSVIVKLTKSLYSLYYVANYNKQLLNFNDTKTGIYRSVVFSFNDKKVLSFSPPKSMPVNAFIDKYPVIDTKILITDAIEGFMVSLFYDDNILKWEIATKGAVGGKYGYYGNIIKNKYTSNLETPSFYKMFLESLRANDNEELNDLAFLAYLPKNACYTFIVHHTKNIIMLPVKECCAYLVSVYALNNNIIKCIPQEEYEAWQPIRNLSGIIKFPNKYEKVSNYNELSNYYSEGANGVMVTNIETGERAKILSNKYEQLKTSIKIPANIQYLYFCLRRMNKVAEYIEECPKHKKTFYNIRNEYEEFITDIHDLYVNIYALGQYSKEINKYHATWCKKIHEDMFVPFINKMIKTTITRKIVRDYFDNFEPRQLLYIMNHDFRV